MNTRISFRRPGSATLLGTCLALAMSSTLAAETSFPAGTYAAEGHKITIAFDDKGQFRVTEGGVLHVSGRYSAKGGQLEITDTQGPWACTKPGEQTGTYRWKYENSVLTFNKLVDRCEDRAHSLTAATWRAKGM